MILKEVTKREDWNIFELFPNAPFTQGFDYGLWQEHMGRKVKKFVVLDEEKPICFLLFVQYKLIFGKKYWYCPYGPIANNFDSNLLIFIKENISKIAKEEKVSFVRFDFEEVADIDVLNNYFTKVNPLLAFGSYIQPRNEWMLYLNKSIEEIRSEMGSNAKLSINKAIKNNVKISVLTGNDKKGQSNLLTLMKETSKRNDFSLHEQNYYKGIFETLNESNAFFCEASVGNEVVVSILIFITGNTAFFLFGGSSVLGSELSASYVTHYKAIEEAKKRSLQVYNFGGITDEKDEPKSLKGVTSFKKKFRGVSVPHKYMFDIVVNRSIYFLYNLRKRISL